MNDKMNISDELLAAFIDGNTTEEQNEWILNIIDQNPDVFEVFSIASEAAGLENLMDVFYDDSEIVIADEPDSVPVIFEEEQEPEPEPEQESEPEPEQESEPEPEQEPEQEPDPEPEPESFTDVDGSDLSD